MAESIVQDWLQEYETIEDEAELQTFASMHELNPEVAEAIYAILTERVKYPDLIHSICNQFHSFYRSNEEKLRRFALQFIPVLIYIYLNSVAMGDRKNCRSVETLLISIYNIEVSTDDGQQKVVSFRMPVLAQASIYHEEKSTLHATDLRRWEENINRDVKWGPLPRIESMNAQNRMKIMTALLFAYNQHISLIQKSALLHLCRTASQLVNQGFSKISGHAHRTSYGSDPSNITSPSTMIPKVIPRITLSSSFLVELIHSIYFAMFNDFGTIATATLEDIHNRGCYEMFTDVILLTNAVRHSLHANPSGQPNDGPMGLSVALTPATTTVVVSKSMITNASFRTKKLPDDIPIQDDQNVPALTSISEEDGGDKQQSQIGSRNVGVRSSKEGGVGAIKAQAQKALIAGFKKVIDKDKDKEKDKEKDNTSTPKSSLVTKNGSIDMSASSGIVSGGTSLASNISSTDSQVNKSQTVIPPKVPVRRDKRASIQINEIQTDHVDKNSPSSSLLSQSQKSSISSGMMTGAAGSASSTPSIVKHNQAYNDSVNINKKDDIIQMQILANGKSNFIVNESIESSVTTINQTNARIYDSVDSNFFDATDSIDSNEVSLPMPPDIGRPSITAIINTNIMELQQQQQHQNEHIDQQHQPKLRLQSEV